MPQTCPQTGRTNIIIVKFLQIWATLFKVTLCYQLKDIVQNHQSHWEPKNWEMGVIREVRNTHGHFTVYLVRLCSLQRSNWIITGKSLLLQYPHIFPLIDIILLTSIRSQQVNSENIFSISSCSRTCFSVFSQSKKNAVLFWNVGFLGHPAMAISDAFRQAVRLSVVCQQNAVACFLKRYWNTVELWQ